VVDTGADIVDLLNRHANIVRQCSAVPCTLWHKPTVLIRLARLIAQQLIAIGLTYCRKVTSGQTSSISRHIDSNTGMVRNPRIIPPMPSVSAMVWRKPYFFGISKSITVAGLYPPTWIIQIA
jgi:hypothetical protein